MLEAVSRSAPIAALPSAEREPLVALDSISKRYGRKTALAGLKLTLRPGDICGFIGANGGGKTTALRMVAGILRPDEGRGTVLGFDLLREAAEIRARVGYLSQRLSLYPELSVFENLRFRAQIYSLTNPRAIAEAAIEEFGLMPWARSPAGSLSGGWARRLQLAASLLHSPPLVLLDEPTSGLDSTARHEVWRRVERLAAEGVGVILCTHDLIEAERCSHAVLFAEGQVVAAGAPGEIAKHSPAVAFLVSGIGTHGLSHDVGAVDGVIGSYPQAEGLRVIADPRAEEHLRHFAMSRGASVTRVAPRLEDMVLAPPLTRSGRPK
jgi:ABC-2 type transport system ATP-binding protein